MSQVLYAKRSIVPPATTGFTALFDPADLMMGVSGFWRADFGVTLAGSDVTAVADSAGSANAMIGSGAPKPQFGATAFNGRPGIIFAGGGLNSLGASGTYPSAVASTFILFQHGVEPLNSETIVCFISNGGTQIGLNCFECNDGPGGLYLSFSQNNVEAGNGGNFGPALGDGNFYLIGMVFDGSLATRYSGTGVLGAATVCNNLIGDGVPGNGVLVGASNVLASGMTVAFAGFTQRAITAADWTNIVKYANTHWGMEFS